MRLLDLFDVAGVEVSERASEQLGDRARGADRVSHRRMLVVVCRDATGAIDFVLRVRAPDENRAPRLTVSKPRRTRRTP